MSVTVTGRRVLRVGMLAGLGALVLELRAARGLWRALR